MCQLPRTQPQSYILVTDMLNGIAEYPEVFPSVDAQKLSDAQQSFEQAKNAYDNAYSQLMQAGAWQKKAFCALKKQIANQAKAAQVDTADNPAELAYIGLGPRRKKSFAASLPPAPPLNLIVRPLDDGALELKWEKNLDGSCGKTVSFIVEARMMTNGNDSDWKIVGTCFGCSMVLKDQPLGVRTEYRVRATNPAGKSIASNTSAAIIL